MKNQRKRKRPDISLRIENTTFETKISTEGFKNRQNTAEGKFMKYKGCIQNKAEGGKRIKNIQREDRWYREYE